MKSIPLAVIVADQSRNRFFELLLPCAPPVGCDDLHGNWTLVRDEGESDESYTSRRESIELILAALRST